MPGLFGNSIPRPHYQHVPSCALVLAKQANILQHESYPETL